MTRCPTCWSKIERERAPIVRGALEVLFDPPIVRWQGCDLPLTRGEHELIAAMAPTGRVRRSELYLLADRNEGAALKPLNSIHVRLNRLRKKLAPHGIVVEMLYGIGYRLVLPQGAQ